jgi:hypothetical protein
MKLSTDIFINKFITQEGDVRRALVTRSPPLPTTIIEAYAMTYDLLTDLELKQKIIDKVVFYINQTTAVNQNYLPYIIRLDSKGAYNPKDFNVQHSLWIAKVLYDHYQITQNNIYYNYAEQVFGIANNFLQNGFNNWRIDDSPESNIPSIKSLTRADLYCLLGSMDDLNKVLDYYNKNLFDKNISLYKSLLAPGYDHHLHENLELVEGLFSVYKHTSDESFYQLPHRLMHALADKVENSLNILAKLQFYYWAPFFDINTDFLKNQIDDYALRYRNHQSLSAYSGKGFSGEDDIFPYIYLLRIFTDYEPS